MNFCDLESHRHGLLRLFGDLGQKTRQMSLIAPKSFPAFITQGCHRAGLAVYKFLLDLDVSGFFQLLELDREVATGELGLVDQIREIRVTQAGEIDHDL